MLKLTYRYALGCVICSFLAIGIQPGLAQEPLVSDNANKTNFSANVEKQLRDTVSLWARAWSLQQADRFIDFYTAEYIAPEFTERNNWIKNRTARIEEPDFISVRLFDFELLEVDEFNATVRFTQLYERPNYSDRTIKQLELSNREGDWKILSEMNLSVEQLN